MRKFHGNCNKQNKATYKQQNNLKAPSKLPPPRNDTEHTKFNFTHRLCVFLRCTFALNKKDINENHLHATFVACLLKQTCLFVRDVGSH